MATDEPPILLLPCAICSRTFKPQSLEKHKRICEQSAMKKRKPFNSAKQRIQGTDLAEFLPKEIIKKKIYQEEGSVVAIGSKPIASWKQTHDEFLKTIRAVRRQTVDTPNERQVVASSNVTVGVPTRPNEKGMCPTCNRQFSIKAYERHVAWCKEHATRVPITAATNVAKERLEARIKYRAPLLKNRKVTNREKYSPGSAVNLSSYSTKNSQQRTKETASTPHCNNNNNNYNEKGGNEAITPGGGAQTHEKARRSAGLACQGIASGPMKSRLSDRSSRPATHIEFGRMKNSSLCPIGSQINAQTRFSLAQVIPASNITSPFPTSRSIAKSESSQIASYDFPTSRRNIFANDRKPINENNFTGQTHRQNIVSATSYGRPKVNDITINDQVIGMTVQRCGLNKTDDTIIKKQGLITWEQISRDKNNVKLAEFIASNEDANFEKSPREIELEESMVIVKNYQKSSDKFSLDFGTPGTKKLNQTYLISEGLDSKKSSSGIFGKGIRRSIVNKAQTEFSCSTELSSDNFFSNLDDDFVSPNGFKSGVPEMKNLLVKRHDEDKQHCSINVDKSVIVGSPVLLSGRKKLKSLDFKVIKNDKIFEQKDNYMSMTKFDPIVGCALSCEDSLNFDHFKEANSIDFNDGSKNIGFAANNNHSVDLLPEIFGSSEIRTTENDPFLTMKRSKINSTSTTELKSLELMLDTKKQLDDEISSEDSKFYNNDNMRDNNFSMTLEKSDEKLLKMENNQFLDPQISHRSITISEKELDANNENDSSKNFDNDEVKIISDKNFSSTSRCLKNTVTSTTETCSESQLMMTQCISKKKSVHEKIGSSSSSINFNLSDSISIEKKLSVTSTDNNCSEIEKNNSTKCVDESSDKSVKNIDHLHYKSVEPSAHFLGTKKVGKKTAFEATKNYQRCGTYVIERATNAKSITKHSASDEFFEEKPFVKRRRTEQNIANNQLNEKSISSEIPSQCSDKIPDKDLESNKNQKNAKNVPSNSLETSAIKLQSTKYKVETADQGIGDICEKFINTNFNCDSDNNLDDGIENLTTTQKQLSDNDLSSYDSYPKVYSDSIVPRKKNSSIFSPNSQKKLVVQDPIEMRTKFEKNMSLVRCSTDTLISSVETSETKIGSETKINSSSIIDKSCEFEEQSLQLTSPRVEKETIKKLDFLATTETIAPLKTSYCGFLPKIFANRITMKNVSHAEETNCVSLNATPNFWDESRRKSNVRHINLDPPNCQKNTIGNMRQLNVRNLPPVVSTSFRKERRRGSCKNYDPFVLAERQMNELLSDTCSSDQSLPDCLANRRLSSSPPSNNYPLSHSSAFVKYPIAMTRSLDNSEKRTSQIAPHSEFGDLTGDFSSDTTETNSISQEILSDLDDSRGAKNNFSRDPKSRDSRNYNLGRRVMIDKSKALGTNEMMEISNRKHWQTNNNGRKINEKIVPKILQSPDVTRSSSLRANSAPKAPERKNNNSSVTTMNGNSKTRSSPGSGSINRNNNYASLSGSNMSLSSIVSSEVEVKRSNSLFDDLARSLEDDVSDIYPSLRSLLKNDSLSISSPVQSNRLRNGQISDEELSSPDGYHKHDHTKLSGDSAYSSLNRKYSNHGCSTSDVPGRQGDNDYPQHRRDGDAGSMLSSAKCKLPKFCHECGCKFPETAKFCCECGIKRLAL